MWSQTDENETHKDMKLSALVLLSLTTVCAVSFQSSSLNSDILEQLANRQIVEFGKIELK